MSFRRRPSVSVMICMLAVLPAAPFAAASPLTGTGWQLTASEVATTGAALPAGGTYALDPAAHGHAISYAALRTGGGYQVGSGFQVQTMSLQGQPVLTEPPAGDRTTTSIAWSWSGAPEAVAVAGLTYAVFAIDTTEALQTGLTATSFSQTGLTPNKLAGIEVRAVTPEGYESECVVAPGAEIDCAARRSHYSLAGVPGAPEVVATDSSGGRATPYGATITLDAGANPAGTVFAVRASSPAAFLDGAGGLSDTALFLDQSVWTHADLRASQWYGYRASARNGDGIVTDYSEAGYAMTGVAAAQPVYHVDVARGNDSTGTGSYEAPYRTIAAAVARAVAGGVGASAPAMVFVWDGIYREQVQLAPYLTLRGRSALNTVLDGTGLASGVPLVTLASNSKVIGFHLRGAGTASPVSVGAGGYDLGHIEILNNVIEGTTAPIWGGLRLEETSGDGAAQSVLIANNTVVGASGHGVYLRYPGTVSFTGNILYGNGGAGLYFWVPGSEAGDVALSNNQAFANGTNLDGNAAAADTVFADPHLDMTTFRPQTGSAADLAGRGAFKGDYGAVDEDEPITYVVPAARWLGLLTGLAMAGFAVFLAVPRRRQDSPRTTRAR
ncbi:MAG: right-handed parallel beta-helix repeat-containing protein [Candidatus Schekmanbacteria bacterium]|nr:right-handed parallel beta-helix repeat-containing protein [Candidatus Schekmanbacteria bacterium]